MNASPQKVTQLLGEYRRGHAAALAQLLPLVYAELRRLAHGYMRRMPGDQTLQATALVHEAYLRLVDQGPADWQNRAHFIGIAAHAMRQILINSIVRRQAAKRGGAVYTLALDAVQDFSTARAVNLVALDEALKQLAALDPPKVRLVELRFFGGLSIAETAEVLHCSPATVKREWASAKAWLHQALTKGRGV